METRRSRRRRAVDPLSGQLYDEARYQAAGIGADAPSDLQVDTSLMTPAQALVAAGYGDDELSLTQGAGRLSAAVTDVALLAAILISQNDNPALLRATIVNDGFRGNHRNRELHHASAWHQTGPARPAVSTAV